MANWIRFTLEQNEYSHWFQIHPSMMNKMYIWMDKMLKRYSDLKIHITYFESDYIFEFDMKYNLIRCTRNNSDVSYYKDFPEKKVNIRKLKLQKINESS
jgi:hypothetical protein